MQRIVTVLCLAVLLPACPTAHVPSTTHPLRDLLKKAPALAGNCPFTACGGNVVKSWTFTESCAAPIPFNDPGCSSSSGQMTPEYRGSLNLVSNDTYSRTVQIQGPMSLHMPASCVQSLGQTCSQVATALNGEGLFQGVTCQADGSGGCNCSGQLTGSQGDSGTYSTSGSTLVLNSSTLPPESNPFCVSSGKLTIQMNGAILVAQ